jgi:hypothetical protein
MMCEGGGGRRAPMPAQSGGAAPGSRRPLQVVGGLGVAAESGEREAWAWALQPLCRRPVYVLRGSLYMSTGRRRNAANVHG